MKIRKSQRLWRRSNWRRKCRMVMVGLLIPCLFFLNGCSNIKNKVPEPDANGKTAEKKVIKPVSGGKLTVGSIEPPSFNPLLNRYQTYHDVSHLIFEGLFEIDPTFHITPVLVDSYTFTSQQKCRIVLKSGLYWSDGSAITASDVAYSISSIKKTAGSIYLPNVENIRSYRVIDSRTIELTMHEANYNSIALLTFPIVPEHIYKKGTNAAPVGSGPYKVADYTKAKEMNLVINEKWDRGSKPYITNINVTFINDAETFDTAFRTKGIDLLSSSDYDWGKYAEQKDVTSHPFNTTSYEYVSLNQMRPALQNKAVRQAMSYALNRSQIIARKVFGNGIATDVPVNPESWLYQNSETGKIYDLEKANRLLNEAGYLDTNNDGYREGVAFTLITNKENRNRVAICEDIAKELGKVGIKITLEEVPFEELRQKLNAGTYDMAYLSYNMSSDFNLSPLFSSRGTKNFGRYSNPELDALLNQIDSTTDETVLKGLYIHAESLILDEVPVISVLFRQSALISRSTIAGDITPTQDNIFYDIEKWFVAS